MTSACVLPGEVDFTFSDLSLMPRPDKVLVLTPEYFEVKEVINPYMKGHVGAINRTLAREQWDAIHLLYQQMLEQGVIQELSVLEGVANLPDMVFCANQSLPWLLPDGRKAAVMSNMKHPVRRAEVQYFMPFYLRQGYQTIEVPEALFLEGNGDVIPHPGRRLLWAGYGHRSDFRTAVHLADLLQSPVIPLQLVNPYFYHLDTCFLPIDEQTVLLCPSAFSEESLVAIRKVFPRVQIVPEEEAISTFALNAVILKGEAACHAIIQRGSERTIQVLRELGVVVYEVDTSEFMKSGGSVFCMKMLYF